MGTLQQINRWSLTHHPRWLVILRVTLGLCLFVKGISFMVNTTVLQDIVQEKFIDPGPSWLLIGITWAHLLGGFLILIGLLTRIAVLTQIPILLGAIFFITTGQQAFGGFELPFALIILLLLLLFLVEGGGPLSLDNFLRKYQA